MGPSGSIWRRYRKGRRVGNRRAVAAALLVACVAAGLWGANREG